MSYAAAWLILLVVLLNNRNVELLNVDETCVQSYLVSIIFRRSFIVVGGRGRR